MRRIDPVSGMQFELDMPGGVQARTGSTLLVDRAAAYLANGPASSQALVANVCQLSALPPVVAEHMASTLLGDYPRFVRTPDGAWRISEPVAPTWRAQEPNDEPLLTSLSFAVVDVEATGGQPFRGDRITEIAIVIVRDGQIERTYETLVNPQRSIPPFVSRLTNITWEMVSGKPTFAGVCAEVVRELDGHIFVAHNAGFDWRMVSGEVQRTSGRVLAGRRLCTVRLARRLLPQLRSRSLDSVTNWYGVEIPEGGRHRAGGDAIATAKCLVRMLHDARGHGCERWSELERFLTTGSAIKKKKRRRRPLAMPQPVSRDTTA
ncbi:MAG: polymerase epsilon subunit [Gemmatimonadetes bacterium]|nr:polymerase epsilon subunit [Gemmatimonadota bacterium]